MIVVTQRAPPGAWYYVHWYFEGLQGYLLRWESGPDLVSGCSVDEVCF